jgi:hypothetical protein
MRRFIRLARRNRSVLASIADQDHASVSLLGAFSPDVNIGFDTSLESCIESIYKALVLLLNIAYDQWYSREY